MSDPKTAAIIRCIVGKRVELKVSPYIHTTPTPTSNTTPTPTHTPSVKSTVDAPTGSTSPVGRQVGLKVGLTAIVVVEEMVMIHYTHRMKAMVRSHRQSR